MADEWYEKQIAFRNQMERWIDTQIEENEGVQWGGGHDEGTFASPWIEHYRMTRDDRILEALQHLTDSFLDWAEENLVEGYWPQQEAHHGPEAFMIFLARMWHLQPDNERIVQALQGAAEHVGNWNEESPDWYDWDNHRFVGWSLGSETAGEDESGNYNVADHFKVAQMALVTHLATGEDRYLQVVEDFAGRWVQTILEDDEIPAAFVPLEDHEDIEDTYSEELVNTLNLPVEDALERHAAAGSMDTMMDLYEITGKEKYADAVAAMLEPMLDLVADAYADPAAPLFGRYRMITDDDRFDDELIERLSIPREYDYYLMMFDDRPAEHPMGLGRRKDAPKWGHWAADGELELINGPSPAALMLLYRLTEDEEAATRAFQLAARRLKLARGAGLPSGRGHGCSGHTINAIVFGHGRSAGAGYAMTLLYPAAIGDRRYVNGEEPMLQYWDGDDEPGLPDDVAALLRRTSMDEASVTLASTSFQPTEIVLGPAQDDDDLVISAGGKELPQDGEGRTPISLPLGQEYQVDISVR